MPRSVAVYCVETDSVYANSKECAQELGLLRSEVSEVINGKAKSTRGYHLCKALLRDTFTPPNSKPDIKTRRRVYCVELDQEYESITECAKELGLSSGTLAAVLNKKRSTTHGYHFCYSEEKNSFNTMQLRHRLVGIPVFCVENGQTYASINQAAKELGLRKSNISRACKGATSVRCCGYHFVYEGTKPDEIELRKKKNVSCPEIQLVQWLRELGVTNISLHRRDILGSGKELDIYLPEHNIAIEFNGSFWHNEVTKDRLYHQGKALECKNLGILLLSVFDHQLTDKFKELLRTKLKINKRVYARLTQVEAISAKDGKEFFETNHMQGRDNGHLYLALKHSGVIVAVMSFGKGFNAGKAQWELKRFASVGSVVGGASKLLKHFINTHNPESIVSYANLQWSHGSLYEQLGFKELHISSPSYWWAKGNTTIFRTSAQRSKLPLLLGKSFNPELSESNNMRSNGYAKIHDCGTIVYLWKRK